MPRVLAGRYELDDVIGAGGMASVYRGTDRFLNRKIAVKVLDDAAARSADPATHARFLNEARSAASFQHPNAVAVYDAGESDGELYIVMELVTGQTLAQRLATDGPLSAPTATNIVAQLLSVLGALHERNIVHRDIKPSNVLLNERGHAKLTDFGIAKRLDEIDEALTSAGMVIGTPQYLAPEQAVGGEITATTDVYLVGALLYEMLTGSRPASPVGGSHTRSTDPRDRRPEVPAALADVVGRALAYLPEQRFPSADAMRTALVAADDGTVESGAAAAAPVDRTAEFPAVEAAERTQLLDAVAAESTTEVDVTDDGPPGPATTETPTATGELDVDDAVDEPSRTTRSPAQMVYVVLAVLAAATLLTMVITLASGGDAPGDDAGVAAEQLDGAAFLARLHDDPSSFGSRGRDLRDELDKVLAITDSTELEEAEEALRVNIFGWVAEGDLDISVGALVEEVLADR